MSAQSDIRQQPDQKMLGEMLLIDHIIPGEEDQTNKINTEKGEELMDNAKIQALFDEVEIYKQAIRDAEDALDSAVQELDETLDETYNQE
jgi:hypothetical protein